MITIVDYGMGNLGSVKNMLNYISVDARISGDADVIAKSDKLLLPGVGAFERAMEKIDQAGLREVLDDKALNEQVPILGICLGMQLLTTSSQESKLPGLGWISAKTKKFPPGDLKVPHMGWNVVNLPRQSLLTREFSKDARFYFVHSYYVEVDEEQDAILTSDYGVKFDAGINRDNIFGVQFHPEKSHKFGMQLLKNFSKI